MLNLRATRNDSILTSFHSNYQLKVIEQMFVDEKCFLSLLKNLLLAAEFIHPHDMKYMGLQIHTYLSGMPCLHNKIEHIFHFQLDYWLYYAIS